MPVKWDTHRTSASEDWITIADVGESLTAYAACRIILVSASSWLDLRASMSSVGLARVISTTRSPSVKLPAVMRRIPWISLFCPILQNEDKKSHKLILYCGFWMYLTHCLGTGVLGPVILTSRASEDPLLVRSPLLIEVGQYYIHTCMLYLNTVKPSVKIK